MVLSECVTGQRGKRLRRRPHPVALRDRRRCAVLFDTTTIFGTPVDITLSEIALESFFPADAATAQALRRRRNSSL